MTTPTHTSAMPAGGILTQHVDQDFADYVAGRPVTQRVCISVLQAAGISSSNQEKGRSNKTKYELVHLVEITDEHEADRYRRQILVEQANRGLLVKQPALFDLTDDEQRDSLLDMIKEHASEQNIPIAELDKQWVTYFGGSEYANSETVQASRSVSQLKEFAYSIGAIAEDKPDDEAGPDNVLRPPFAEAGDAADDREADDDATPDAD